MLLKLLEVTLVIFSALGQGDPQMASNVPRDSSKLGVYGNVRMPDGHGSGKRMRESEMELPENGNGMSHDGIKMPYYGIRMSLGRMGMPSYEMGKPWFEILNDELRMAYNEGQLGGKMGVPNDWMRPELKMEPPFSHRFRIPGGGLSQDFWKGEQMQGGWWPFKSMIGRRDFFKMRPMRGYW